MAAVAERLVDVGGPWIYNMTGPSTSDDQRFYAWNRLVITYLKPIHIHLILLTVIGPNWLIPGVRCTWSMITAIGNNDIYIAQMFYSHTELVEMNMKYTIFESTKHVGMVEMRGRKITLLYLFWVVGWLCWGLTSQSTIFQSYRDGAIYFE